MRKLACMLLGIAMATGLLVGLSATDAVAPKAEAANYVSRMYTARLLELSPLLGGTVGL